MDSKWESVESILRALDKDFRDLESRDDLASSSGRQDCTSTTNVSTGTQTQINLPVEHVSKSIQTDQEQQRQRFHTQIDGLRCRAIPNTPLHLSTMKSHFDMMYCFGISPIRGDGSRGSNIQEMTFVLISCIALLDGAINVKRYVLEEATKGNLYQYVKIWYYMSGLILRMFFVKLAFINPKRIQGILRQSDVLHGEESQAVSPNVSILAVVAALGVVLTSLFDSLLIYEYISGWPYVDIILIRSSDIGRAFFLWTKANSTNASAALHLKYGEELSGTNLILGCLGFVIKFFGRLHVNLVRDMMLMMSLCLCNQSKHLKSLISLSTCNDLPKEKVVSRLWHQYETVHIGVVEIDACFGSLFKLIHADNLLIMAYFFLHILYNDFGIWVLFRAPTITKIVWIYWISPGSSEVTEILKKKIHETCCSLTLTNEVELKLNMVLLLDKLNTYPICMGMGNFAVDESFVLKFVGIVVSLFMFFVDSGDMNS